MSNDTPLVQTWHEDNLAEFARSNGNRNTQLNTLALKSFNLAVSDDNLSVSKVESDYMAAGKQLGMDEPSIKATLRSALKAATPRDIAANGGNTPNSNGAVLKTNLALAPIYTALEDYALAHGVPVSALQAAGWTEDEHKGRKCLLVPCEDGVTRARFLDGNSPKWMPIKKDDTKITPCWYGFRHAPAIAAKSKYKSLVICNGQPSVVTAQHYGIPAIAQTDGENKDITTPLLRRLETVVKEHKLKIILAYDGDETGRASTDRIKKQLAANGITARIVQFGGDDGYDLADYCKQHKVDVMDKLIRLASYSDRKNEPVLSRSQLANRTHGMIVAPKEYVPPGEVLICPFKSFHKLGGFAYLFEPQKMTMVLAPSGGGKTSFLETWQDIWNKQGIDTMFFSPEWSPIALQHRSIQRFSGIPTAAIKLHLLWEREAQLGIPSSSRCGVNIAKGSDTYKRYLAINNELADWPGMVYAFQGQKATGEILEAMSKQLYKLRRDGRRVGVAFFDYVQLMRPDYTEEDRNRYESICDSIKDWCGDNWIHPIVASQPTKAVGNASRKGERILDEYDSHWVRPDAFNLVVTLNIKENEVFENGVGTGVMKKETHGIANICKNNEGVEEQIQLSTNFSHLAWEDNLQNKSAADKPR